MFTKIFGGVDLKIEEGKQVLLAFIKQYVDTDLHWVDISVPDRQMIMKFAGMFGIDAGNDHNRFMILRNEIFPLILKSSNEIIEALLKYVAHYPFWTASGAHRFMPLAVAAKNILDNKNVFSLERSAEFDDDTRHYFAAEHPIYANPLGLDKKYIPEYTPELIIKLPAKDTYTWIDIGSAPKIHGAPTLNLLNRNIPEVQYSGVDLEVPCFTIKNDEIVFSEYMDSHGNFKEKSVVNGVSYFNASVNSSYSITADDFMGGKKYDFVSTCMTLQHITYEDEPVSATTLSRHTLISYRTKEVFDKKIHISATQQKAIHNMLSHLEPGGILFINILTPKHNGRYDYGFEGLDDLYFIIQRSSDDRFVIYEDHPIVFRPNRDDPFEDQYDAKKEFWPAVSLIEGIEAGLPWRINKGIKNYLHLANEQRSKLIDLFSRTALLVVRHQSWGNSIWSKIDTVIELIKKERPIIDLFEAYLAAVPDDDPLKKEILQEVMHL